MTGDRFSPTPWHEPAEGIIILGDGRAIECHVVGNRGNAAFDAVCEANAQLCFAAPALLSALRDLLDCVTAICAAKNRSFTEFDLGVIGTDVAKARAALAAATGGGAT